MSPAQAIAEKLRVAARLLIEARDLCLEQAAPEIGPPAALCVQRVIILDEAIPSVLAVAGEEPAPDLLQMPDYRPLGEILYHLARWELSHLQAIAQKPPAHAYSALARQLLALRLELDGRESVRLQLHCQGGEA